MVIGTLPQCIAAAVNLVERLDRFLVAARFVQHKPELVVVIRTQLPTELFVFLEIQGRLGPIGFLIIPLTDQLCDLRSA
ncbi:MAG: Uncharacterised protein [Cryomorphaceae bacterium]|nr:MAG: Uncharacterised protein [Cryomorphaceae bacterium]